MGEDIVLILFLIAPLISGWLLVALVRGIRNKRFPSAWPQILAVNSLIFITLFGVLCLVGEVYFRFFYDTTDSLNYSKVTQRWFGRYWVVNVNGVRDNINYPISREKGKRRISFLGDSFTAGHGVKSVEDRFANIIRREHPEWEVQVLAMPGYDTGAELKFLRFLLANNYEFDQVVLIYCLNDISDLVPRRHEELDAIDREIKNRGWLLRNSFFFDIVWHRISVRRNPFMRGYFDLVKDAYQGPLWETQKQRLRELRDLVETNGGRLSVVVFPFLQALDKGYAYEQVHKQLEDYWQQLGVPHRDLLPLYRGMKSERITVHPFDAHPNEYAHSLAAAAIGGFIQTNLQTMPQATRPSSGSATNHGNVTVEKTDRR
jgi:hypothetical protein